jgi:transcriptional regulator with XRE-family HTH domain
MKPDATPVSEPAQQLARRLRELRLTAFTDEPLTQAQLAKAIGVSVPLVSSWENVRRPTPLPQFRLVAYATLFATARAVANGKVRVLPARDLTPQERARRDELEAELAGLRAAATGDAGARPDVPLVRARPAAAGPWYFADQRPVTIVCAPLPDDLRKQMPYTHPDDPDYVALYSYADLDSLIELHGHIRTINPDAQVNIRLASDLVEDDFTTHLILLGGVDWNVITRHLLDVVRIPVRQMSRDDHPTGAAFEVTGPDGIVRFPPVLRRDGARNILVEDVAHFIHGPNPFNRKRTVTVCNGMYGRGTYGAVRSLTDERFRDRNGEYVRERFQPGETFSILTRVRTVGAGVATPDWTLAETRLHEWPEATG